MKSNIEKFDIELIDFEKGNGTIAVVTIDDNNGEVLMLAYADRQAIELSLSTGQMHYLSRTRGLWHKGATSGNFQKLIRLSLDCDNDSIIAHVISNGPACHLNTRSCFREVDITNQVNNSDIPILEQIQKIQHSDLSLAQDMTKAWFKNALDIEATDVILTPQPTSLNSFNGIAIINAESVFFKSHTEPDSVITEYYNCQILDDAKYSIVKPLRTERSLDQQIVFYPVINYSTLFDLSRSIEREENDKISSETIIKAEKDDCLKLQKIYSDTLELIDEKENALAPIHQLFFHRITGERFIDYYDGKSIDTLDDSRISIQDLFNKSWTINGVKQGSTLGELIDRASIVLDPSQKTYSCIGHGDAHFGNIFLDDDNNYLYFDPAFAGRHSPILDMVKPFFHNIFAQWMYFSQEKAKEIDIKVSIDDDNIKLEYSGAFTSLRKELYEVKQEYLVNPIMEMLIEKGESQESLMELFSLALMCCPLLTRNLSDTDIYSPSISWLGFAIAVQLGNGFELQDFRFLNSTKGKNDK